MSVRAGRLAALLSAVALAGGLGGCPAPPTPRETLAVAWHKYEKRYIAPGGFVVDPSRGGGEVISEAQGYALLRAVWSCDEATFDRVLDWTDAHLRRADGLYSWHWSPREGRLLDENTATDADEEIALALTQAARAFARPELDERARTLLRAIREHESIDLPGGWFPAAGNWAVQERIVNLSYFLPYAYPEFARLDPASRWDEALDWGYRLLEESLRAPGALLPPDFMVVDRAGAIQPLPASSRLSRVFSFDAMRLYFRLALDCELHGRAAACESPLDPDRLLALRDRDGELATAYSTDGRRLASGESLSFYGSLLPALAVHEPARARSILAGPLSARSLSGVLDAPDRYYDLNWIWFGLAAEDGLIAERWDRPCPAHEQSPTVAPSPAASPATAAAAWTADGALR